MNFNGTVAINIGLTSGIGQETAFAIARAGAEVMF